MASPCIAAFCAQAAKESTGLAAPGVACACRKSRAWQPCRENLNSHGATAAAPANRRHQTAGVTMPAACGRRSMAGLQLPKLITWVRFPSPAPSFPDALPHLVFAAPIGNKASPHRAKRPHCPSFHPSFALFQLAPSPCAGKSRAQPLSGWAVRLPESLLKLSTRGE